MKEKHIEGGELNHDFCWRDSNKESVEKQVIRQQKPLKYKNHLSEIVGKWPGDESIEEIIKSLD